LAGKNFLVFFSFVAGFATFYDLITAQHMGLAFCYSYGIIIFIYQHKDAVIQNQL
jgi:hypothetical protein